VLFGIVFVAIEIIAICMADTVLEATTSRLTRIGKIGIPSDDPTTPGANCDSYIRKQAQQALAPWAVSGNVDVDVYVWNPAAPVSVEDATKGAANVVCDTGGPGDMVVYHIGFDKPGLTGFMSWLGGDSLHLQRTVIIQNEPSE
jgi:hypothetical protein